MHLNIKLSIKLIYEKESGFKMDDIFYVNHDDHLLGVFSELR